MDVSSLTLAVRTDGMSEAQTKMEGLTNTAGILEKAAKGMLAGFAFYKVADWVKDISLLSARYETLGVSMNTVGKNAGYTAASMTWYQKALQDTGISALESRDTLTMMAAAQIDLGKSSQLARIAQDAAVIGNINSSEAFQRMIQGIRSGQVEILRTVGINVTFEQGYQRLAKSLGKATADLSEYEKMQSRTNQVMEYGKNIAGTYEAAMGTAGKQLKSMERYSQDLQLQLGAVFQPSLNVLVEDMSKALKGASEWMVKNKDATDGLGIAMAEVVRQSGGFLDFLGKVSGGGETASGGVGLITRATQGLSLALADVNDGLAGIWGGANLALASVMKLGDEVSKKLVGGSGANQGGNAEAWKNYAMRFLDPLGNGTGAYAQWQKRTFGGPDRTYADWTKVGMSDSEGLEGGDPYGEIRARQKASALEAAKKASEEYNKILVPLNLSLAMEKVLYRDGERAAYAYRLQMVGIRDADAAALLVKWDTVKALKEWHKVMEDLDKAEQNWQRTKNKQKEVNPLMLPDFGGFQAAQDLGDPLRWDKDQLQMQGAALDRWKSTMSVEQYTKALDTLRLKDLQIRAQEGQTWAIIGLTVTQNAGMATDSMVAWANNTDGLGRSWTTLGSTVRNVLHDMVVQMEKAIVQQRLMQPFLSAIGAWLTPAFNDTTHGTGTGNYGDPGFDANYGMANPGGGNTGKGVPSGSTINSSVNVTVHQGTGQTQAEVTGASVALGNRLKAVVLGVLDEESRHGGRLARN